MSLVVFTADYLEQVEMRLAESTFESPSGQQREEIPTLPPVLQTDAAPDTTASASSNDLKLLSVFTVRNAPGCKHEGENVTLLTPFLQWHLHHSPLTSDLIVH